jgi:hypothetical protein
MTARRQDWSTGILRMIGSIKNALSNSYITVLVENSSRQVLLALVSTTDHLPSIGDSGFAKGCILIDTSTGRCYSNVGLATSANFLLHETIYPFLGTSYVAASLVTGQMGYDTAMRLWLKKADSYYYYVTMTQG